MKRLFHIGMAVICAWCLYDTANTHEVKISWWAMSLLWLVWFLEHTAAAISEEPTS